MSSAPDVATHLSVTPSASTATAGTPINITVQALDGSGAVVSSYGGTVHFTSTDKQAILPPDSTLTGGRGTFLITLQTTGNQTVTATDEAQSSIAGTSNVISVKETQANGLAISSGTPPNGAVGVNYDVHQGPACQQGSAHCVCIYLFILGYSCHVAEYGFLLQATGGVSPYNWTWTASPSSSLPPGLVIELVYGSDTSMDCCVSAPGIGGTPTRAGTYDVVVTVTDSASPPAQATAAYAISISPPPPPVINTTNSPSAGVNLPYSFTFAASGGQQPLTWKEAGALPPGLTFATTGVLAGTPSVTGSFPITVIAKDSAGQDSAPQSFTVQVFPHGFAPTSNMQSARFNLSATFLSNGKVLVAGGQDANGNTLATAELYDSASETFASTGSMATALSAQITTPLFNGRILVCGGFDASGNATNSAELYDPTNATFSATGAMGSARGSHTAVLLSGGKVLVTGGLDATGTALSSAELYDPITRNFSATGSMGTARSSHTVTLLGNGKVLITGGIGVSGTLATAEIYDPVNQTFSATGSMASPRSSHRATLLNNGMVLVTGGTNASTPGAELYDPSSGTFTPAANMTTMRSGHTAILLNNGTVLLAGGVDTNGSPLTSAEVFDPVTGQFTPTGGLQTPRYGHAAALLGNGTALVTGGGNATVNALASGELYQ